MRAILAGARSRFFRGFDADKCFVVGHQIRSSCTPEGRRGSVGHSPCAIELDPDCVAVMVSLAISIVRLSGDVEDGADASALVPRSLDLAERPVEISRDGAKALPL